ncbi:PREDICTED: centrosome-associated protein CEP250 isoform X2 [Crocodylus porosus]|uniref:centrosome-associated protein CEP250 isoform X2 n=1 Tax=Crocodylus porosus TaxID=8502 RepID=UPI000938A071|nr:PREDICTED: centrosome-associated protein CEP250 isoform X2 [Crocodylus porosus]
MQPGSLEVSSMKLQSLQLLPEEDRATLHQQKVESQASYQHKLQSSQEAQQRQAVLVRKLQAKVLQYRNWCRELKQQLEMGGGPLTHRWEAKEEDSLEKALVQLEEEQQRCENLAETNVLLREHLDKANEVNAALREDIRKLTADWTRAQDELELKKSEWHAEREIFEGYLQGEHNRLLSLWRQVVTFRRYFLEMKTATDRDLSELKAEQMKLSGSILVNCLQLNSGTQLWESSTLGRPALKDHIQQNHARSQEVEKEINWKDQEAISLKVKGDIEKEELQERVLELSALLLQSQKQNKEKEKTMKTLSNTVEILESTQLEIEYEASQIKNAKEENLSLQQMIKDLTQVVLDDTDSTIRISWAECFQHPESSNFSDLIYSDTKSAFALVREALARKHKTVQALWQQLSASQDSVISLEHQKKLQDEECKTLQQRLKQLEEECKTLTSQRQHLQLQVETLSSNCVNLEKSKKELKQQLKVTEQEAWHLRQSNTKLQLKEDATQGEKEEQQEEMGRVLWEKEQLQKDLGTFEAKHSLLWSKLVATREALEKSQLDGELVKQEKHELILALEKAEQSVASLTGAQNELKAEVADLRDVAAKMSGINEVLALDKVQLNQFVLQLEQENQALLSKIEKMERAKTSVQEELSQSKRVYEELCTEKKQLEQLLQKTEMLQEELQVELKTLREERKEIQEKLNQVCHQQELSSTDLEQTRLESSHHREVLTKVSTEKEALLREKVALEVRLGVVERDRQGISEQLAEIRSAKDVLESSLFEAQQLLFQLEVTKGQLEMQLQTVTQAKEVLQGEVKCLHCELEAEKSAMEQDRMNMEQQLSQKQQQYQDTLNLQQTVYEKERNKLIQELEKVREQHNSELKEVLEHSAQEKTELTNAFETKLLDLRQEAATVQTQKEEERARAENNRREVLLEKERERKALLEALLQAQGELTDAYQQLEQLQQKMQEQQGKEQDAMEGLQIELQEVQSRMEAVENRHREEIRTFKEETSTLVQQRDTLQNQVQDLKLQLVIAKDSWQVIDQETRERLSKAQQLSNQKVLEVAHIQEVLEGERKRWQELEHQNTELQTVLQNLEGERRRWQEVECQNTKLQAALRDLEEERSQWQEVTHQNTELQAALQDLEGERRQWEEVEHQNMELQASVRDLESKIDSLTLSLEEKELRLKTLQERGAAQQSEIVSLQSAIHQAQQLHFDYQGEIQELKNQVQSLRQTIMEKEAGLQAHEKQLLQDLEESQAGELHLRNSLQKLEAEVSQLHLSLHSTESRAEALAAECHLASDAHHEAQSQLARLHSLLQHIHCGSTDLSRDLASVPEQESSWDLAVPQPKDLPAELLADQVATAFRDLQQNLKQTQQDLDDTRNKAQQLDLELKKSEAERECLNAHNQELQKKLAQSQEEMQMAEDKYHSVQATLQEEVVALKKEVLTLHGEVASLERRLKDTEKQKMDIVHERDTLQAAKEKLVWEMDLLQESVKASETRANTAAKISCCLEQELQKTLSALQIKSEEVETQCEKIQTLQEETALGKALQEKMDHMSITLTKRDEEVESQREQIRELERQREIQKATLDHLVQELKEKEQEVASQQENVRELERQKEMQKTALDHLTKDLEEKVNEIKFQEKKIQTLEKHKTSQLRNLLEDIDQMKASLREKDQKLSLQKQLAQELEVENKQVKALHISLERVRGVLKERESEADCQREQIKIFQQYKDQQEGQLQVLHEKIKQMTLTLTERDQELESQKKQVLDVEEETEKKLKTYYDKLEQTQSILREKERELEFQIQQAREQEEKAEEQLMLLQRDLECTKAALKERDDTIESQKEKIWMFQKQEREAEQQLKILESLEVSLREREQEVVSLKRQREESKEEEEKQTRAMQENLEEGKLTQSGKEREREVLENIYEQQQQKIEAETQTKAVLDELEYTKSSLQGRDKEIQSLQEHVKVLLGEKELEEKWVKSLQQDLDRMRQILKRKDIEFLKQAEQITMYQLQEESMQVALESFKNQTNHLEHVAREQSQENETLKRKLQQQEKQLVTLHYPHLTHSEKETKEMHPRGRQSLLGEALNEREQEINAQGERKQLEEKMKHFQENLHQKEEVIKHQREKARHLEETMKKREQELGTQTELLKQITSALQCKDDGETLNSQIQRLLSWEKEEAARKKELQERDDCLERQKNLIRNLEDEKKVKVQELEHLTAILKQAESGEIRWREKAQALAQFVAQSEVAIKTLREETAILQSMVSERDKDRLYLQEQLDSALKDLKKSIVNKVVNGDVSLLLRENQKAEELQAKAGQQAMEEEAKQPPWGAERKLLQERLEQLQQAIARLEHDKTEQEQLNAQLRKTLEQVECERRRLKKERAGPSLSDACVLHMSSAGREKAPSPGQKEAHTCHKQFARLQKQVSLLKTQLMLERKQKQDYIECCAKTSQELSGLHQELSHSLAAVARDPKATVLEIETEKLDESLNYNLILTALEWDSQSSEKHLLDSMLRAAQPGGLR